MHIRTNLTRGERSRVQLHLAWVAALVTSVALAPACGDDDSEPTRSAGAPDGGGVAPTTTGFTLRIENVGRAYPFLRSGVFTTPVGANEPGPIGPGQSYEVTFTAPPGARLGFATMFVPSNDFFYAPGPEGIALYDAEGQPLSGDVTSSVALWDAGTEVNQEPGSGLDQVQRQARPDTGAPDPDATVRRAPDTFTNLPAVSDVIRVTLTPSAGSRFTLRIEDVSTPTTLQTSDGMTQAVPLSPGVYVVHDAPGPLFVPGEPVRGRGLEAIAEDGMPTALATYLATQTGVTVPLSPGVYAVHDAGTQPLFTLGQHDRGAGLEAIAEDGQPMMLGGTLESMAGVTQSGVFAVPVGATMAGPAGPGQAYEVTFGATAGQRLSFATMYVESNDLFFAPPPGGLPLFDAGGDPIYGDVTDLVELWDVGTEANEEPGVGPNQVIRQRGPNSGPPDPTAMVRQISAVQDGYSYATAASVLRVTLSRAPNGGATPRARHP